MGLSKRLYEEIEQFEQQALNGEINEVGAYFELKQLEDLIKEKKENVSNSAMRLVRLEKDYKLEKDGYIFQIQQKTNWKFDHIKKFVEKKEELKTIMENAKLAYQLSQKNTFSPSDFENPGSQIFDVHTSEVIDIAIPEYSEPFLKIDKIKPKK